MEQMEHELHMKAKACAKVSVDFTKRYYETFDKRRAQVSSLFVEGGTLAWGGSVAGTKDDIRRLLSGLPTSVHELVSLDARPIVDEPVGGPTTAEIQISGSVKYTGKPPAQFAQSFTIMLYDGQWGIVTTTYHILEPIFETQTQEANCSLNLPK